MFIFNLILCLVLFSFVFGKYVPKERQIRVEIRDLQKQHNRLKDAGDIDGANEVNEKIQRKFDELKVEREEERRRSPEIPFDHDSLSGFEPGSSEYTEAYIQAKIEQYRLESDARHKREMEDRLHHSRHSRSRLEMDKERHDEHRTHIRDRADDMISRVNRASFSPEEAESIKMEIDEWHRLEMQSIQARENMGIEFEKARDIHDKDDRKAYLEKMRIQRESRRDGELKLREQVREKKRAIDQKIRDKTIGSEL